MWKKFDKNKISQETTSFTIDTRDFNITENSEIIQTGAGISLDELDECLTKIKNHQKKTGTLIWFENSNLKYLNVKRMTENQWMVLDRTGSRFDLVNFCSKLK